MRLPLPGVLLAAAVVIVVASILAGAQGIAHAAPVGNDTLSFEAWGPSGGPVGWGGGPPETIHCDSVVVHGGRYAARIERSTSSPSTFSTITGALPITFAGDSIEIRGWLKTDVVVGFAGLWLRQDAAGGMVQFDNMQSRGLAGTTPWTAYRVVLPLDKRARSLVFGALLGGYGVLRVDDLDLRVDGKPLAEARPAARETTAVERDHEFDAGSGVTDTLLSARQVEHLALLGKVWGFVKYHHPSVTGAKLNWDYELFRVVPRVLAARSRVETRRELSRWLARVGEPDACKPCASAPESIAMQPRVDWIRDRALLGADLSARLARIHANRHAMGNQHYVSRPAFGAGNADFSNEAMYAQSAATATTPRPPDPGYRLLAVLRFWNIIEYWFPYRDLIRERWDGVLAEFIPRAMAASTNRDYRLAMLSLVARARDGHANVWSATETRPPRGTCQLPVVVRHVEDRYVIGAYADSVLGPASGLRIGDVLLALDDLPVDSLTVTWAEYYGASNEPARRREIARALTKGACGPCRVTIEREGGRIDLTATRDSTRRMDRLAGGTHDRRGDVFQLLSPEIAYLKLSSVKQSDTRSYIERAAGTRCLVIDIRNYPNEFVPFALGQHLVERATPFARFTAGDLANPGTFTWTPSISISPGEPRYQGKVVILVDETSQSQAEYTAMALRAAPGALVVGSTTAGADGNVSAIMLPGALRAMISGIGVFYPDKRPTQQIGVVPDLVVEPTIAGLRAGRDEVLEAALEKALGRKVPVPGP